MTSEYINKPNVAEQYFLQNAFSHIAITTFSGGASAEKLLL